MQHPTAMQLEGKVAYVTGAASGMGYEIVSLFAAHGATVALADVQEGRVTEAVEKLRGDGHQALGYRVDVTDRATVEESVRDVERRTDGIDIVVNCAGMAHEFTPIEKIDDGLYRRVMDVNVDGVFHVCRAVVPALKERRRGSIINIASVVAVRPRPGLTAYVAAKNAVIGMTKSLALETAADGVRVNCIAPGAAETPMLNQFIGESNDIAKGREMYVNSIPMGRLADPGDIARGALYLASDNAGFVTGEVIAIDGGRSV